MNLSANFDQKYWRRTGPKPSAVGSVTHGLAWSESPPHCDELPVPQFNGEQFCSGTDTGDYGPSIDCDAMFVGATGEIQGACRHGVFTCKVCGCNWVDDNALSAAACDLNGDGIAYPAECPNYIPSYRCVESACTPASYVIDEEGLLIATDICR